MQQSEMKARAKVAYQLYNMGHSVSQIAEKLNFSAVTIRGDLRRFHGVKFSKTNKAANEPSLCQECDGPPTERDDGKLTRMKKNGAFVYICSDCMLKSFDSGKSYDEEDSKVRENHFKNLHRSGALAMASEMEDTCHFRGRVNFTGKLNSFIEKNNVPRNIDIGRCIQGD